MTIKVLVADDHGAIRAGLALILGGAEGIAVVGEAADGATAVRMARTLRPDVVLMDVRMPGVDGIEATRELVGDGVCEVLVLTTFDLDDYVYAAMRAGAGGFLLKSVEAPKLIEAIRAVAAGDGAGAEGDPADDGRVRRHERPGRSPAAHRAGPADRARVRGARLPRRGLSNTEIAGLVFASESTVKTHVGAILRKLGLRDRVQIVVFAHEHGLVGA